MPHKRILAAILLAACAAPVQAADDNKVTIENRIAQCQGCHGIPGWKTAFPEVYHVPKLGGQKPGYIVAALKEYRSGDRDFATMRAIAANLSDADIDKVAAYYGGQPPAAPAPAPAAPAAAPAPVAAPAPASATAPATNATHPAASAAKKK
ncbi:MAG TPA: c-type cytochrome [Usitatibacter sp.]|nr:c-type cytochrome [Usitatibacter sp.]